MAASLGDGGPGNSGAPPETQQQVDYWNQVNNQWLQSETGNRIIAWLETTEGKIVAAGSAALLVLLMRK